MIVILTTQRKMTGCIPEDCTYREDCRMSAFGEEHFKDNVHVLGVTDM